MAAKTMLENDRQIILNNQAISDAQRKLQLEGNEAVLHRFEAILDEECFEALRAKGEFRLSHRAFLAALFTHLYRDRPMFHLPFRYLTLLVEIDEGLTQWRMRHSLMVHRMLRVLITREWPRHFLWKQQTRHALVEIRRVFIERCGVRLA